MANADFGAKIKLNGDEITKDLKETTDDASGNDDERNEALTTALRESGLNSVSLNIITL